MLSVDTLDRCYGNNSNDHNDEDETKKKIVRNVPRKEELLKWEISEFLVMKMGKSNSKNCNKNNNKKKRRKTRLACGERRNRNRYILLRKENRLVFKQLNKMCTALLFRYFAFWNAVISNK